MIRLLLFLAALALAAYGLTWIAENPGEVALTWGGVEYDVSLIVALGAVVALAILLSLAWGVIRFVFRLPSLVSLAARARRREHGYTALSRGMIAIGSGDARAASRHADEARKRLGDEPLAKLLRAQAAQVMPDTGRSTRSGAVVFMRGLGSRVAGPRWPGHRAVPRPGRNPPSPRRSPGPLWPWSRRAWPRVCAPRCASNCRKSFRRR